MASLATKEVVGKKLYYFKTPSRWQKGVGPYLPQEYKKFFMEWKVKKPEPVHYIPREGRYYRDEETGLVHPVQNIPIPLKFPKEHDEGLWGGEGVIQGFTKKDRYNRRVPKFWFPYLISSVVYSEVLDIYLKVNVTNRALQQIHDNYGLDHYILKTSACDLRGLLAIKLKRRILHALEYKTLYPNDTVKREEIYESYKKYLTAYTPEEIEWYGLTFKEACLKWKKENSQTKVVQPIKIELRTKLLEELKNSNEEMIEEKSSWISKITEFNPFKSKSTTD